MVTCIETFVSESVIRSTRTRFLPVAQRSACARTTPAPVDHRHPEYRPSLEQLIDIFANVAEAVDYVHRRGFLHRNIKPSVILLDRSGLPRLTGFTFAVAREGVASAKLAGTPHYMAPEQLASDQAELVPQTDVWGLGATLYHTVTGRRPFDGDGPFERLFERIRDTHPPPPSSINGTAPAELDRICLKCLSKLPKDRYRDAASIGSFPS